MRVWAFAISAGVAFAALIVMWKPEPASATPVFGQAIGGKPGMNCQLCHTMVPQLNAYGRYVQNTYFSGFSYQAMKGVAPFWIKEEIKGDSNRGQDPKATSDTVSIGNWLADANGFAGPKVTYRVEQELYSDNQGGGSLGIAWVAYNGLLNDNGHVAVGELYPAEPSFIRNPIDVGCGFYIRHFVIGTHVYNFVNSRWGGEFHYVKGWLDAEIGAGYGGGSLISASTFSLAPGTDRATQWKIAYAPANHPLEFGAFGTQGNFILRGSTGAVDRYNMVSEYVQRDPYNGVPGLFAYDMTTFDSNPGIPKYLDTYNRDDAIEIYDTFLKGAVSLSLRNEFSSRLGVATHYNTAGLNVIVPYVNYVFARLDMNMGGYSSVKHDLPEYDWTLQYEGPIVPFRRRSEQVAAAGAEESPSPQASQVAAGGNIFSTRCAACHQANGQGLPGAFPALAGNPVVTAEDPSGIITIVKHGKGGMPSFGSTLSNAEIADVLSYIRTSWGNTASTVTEAQVSAVP